MSYYGGGVMARYDLQSGVYFDTSLRAGSVKTKYRAHNYTAEYNVSANYYGAHAGIGRVWMVRERDTFDLYTRYFWSRQNATNVNVGPDSGRFWNMDSSRLRLGGRYTFNVNERFSPYVGAAYEHEFDGRARACMNGVEVANAPKLAGGSGIVELGFSLEPAQTTPFSIELGLKGHFGRREGVTASLRFGFEF
jgi:outer membrane autotransporter protein